MSEPLVDLAALLESVDGDHELLDEMAGTFVAEVPGWLTSLRTAVSQGDSAAVFRVAHGVAGAVSYFKASGVRQVAAEVEAMGREGRLDGVPGALDRLESGLTELSRFLGSAPWRQ